METLSTILKSKEEELRNIDCTKTEHIEAKTHMKQAEKKYKYEGNVLTNKFKIVCQKLRETKIAYDEAKYIMNHDVYKIKNSVTELIKPSEEEDNNQNKLKILVQQLKEENYIKNKKLYQLNMKVKNLELEKKSKISTQKRLMRNMKIEKGKY